MGLLGHPASVDGRYRHAVERFSRAGFCRLTALFGPQHGFLGQTQDNMVEWDGYRDAGSGLPVFSLYGKTRKPTAEMLDVIDVLAVDLQDVGARYYTFIWTLDLCMEALARAGKSMVVLDRPNPIGGSAVEGPVLEKGWESFVGRRCLPVRHGMTVGEIATYLKETFHLDLELVVIRMQGWNRTEDFESTGLPWFMPSPNMPTVDTAFVYPGLCLLEGTNLSEGRGTTRPFEIFGAPFIEPARLVARLREFKLPGVLFRPLSFEPTFQKHAGRLCGGAQIHVLDRKRFRPVLTGAAILRTALELYPRQFRWKRPPYEYERKKLPIDILAGTDRLRQDLEGGRSLSEMGAAWKDDAAAFMKRTAYRFLLY